MQLILYTDSQNCAQRFLDFAAAVCYAVIDQKQGGGHMKLGTNIQYLRKLNGNMTALAKRTNDFKVLEKLCREY